MAKNKDVGRAIGALHNQIKRYFEWTNVTASISGMQGRILHYLLAQGDTHDIFPKDLENVFNIRRTTVSRYLISMESIGIVTRAEVTYDARLKKIVLTQKAKALSESIFNDVAALESRLTKNISQADIETFLRIAESMQNNMNI